MRVLVYKRVLYGGVKRQARKTKRAYPFLPHLNRILTLYTQFFEILKKLTKLAVNKITSEISEAIQ